MARTKVRLSPTDISDKWNKRTKAAVSDAVAGVNRVEVDPGQAAVDQQEKMRTNVVAAIDDGTWARRRLAVSKSEWQQKTAKKMQERMGGGVDAAMTKRQRFDAYNASRLNEILPTIADMPSMTLSDSLARVQALMEHMASQPYKKSG